MNASLSQAVKVAQSHVTPTSKAQARVIDALVKTNKCGDTVADLYRQEETNV